MEEPQKNMGSHQQHQAPTLRAILRTGAAQNAVSSRESDKAHRQVAARLAQIVVSIGYLPPQREQFQREAARAITDPIKHHHQQQSPSRAIGDRHGGSHAVE